MKDLAIINKTIVSVSVLLLLAWAHIAISQQSKVPTEIWEKAKAKGIVRVIVGLKVPWQPQGQLSQQERMAQREAIAAAQDELLAALAGKEYTLIRRFNYSSALALDLGPDALAVVENSTLVISVTEDLPVGLHHAVPKTKNKP